MTHNAIRYAMSTAIIGFFLAASVTSAETTIKVIEEQTTTIGLESAIDFNIYLSYEGFGSLSFYAERTLNSLPDQNWFSTICMDDYCYRDTENKTEPVSVASGETYHVKFSVYTSDIEAAGNFQLKLIASGPGAEVLGTLDFSVASSGASSVTFIESPVITPFPTPATTALTIPVTSLLTESTTLEIFDASGASVTILDRATLESNDQGIRLNVSEFPVGAYFFRIRENGVLRTGRFLVSR